ncbi:UNVERIFIED_CONTAM: putative mitochondrial protein [Sesamum latifolium]|uniref:Mitochondrial protein n=1 Tax=Sesamum latifolium TaxID=2727402 RepID=A0AAW2WXU7_9LAMI
MHPYKSPRPDVPRPELISQFRPISLCNVIYKLVSKTIANRLKPLLGSLISPSQSAFVPGRSITDNVLIAYEINHFLLHKTWGKDGHVSLKLDVSKAYDCVEWIFLERVLTRLGFHPKFVSLIMRCVTSVSYSFLLNGDKFGWLTPERGLRQGDPLSPYLYLFCAEALSALIRCAEEDGRIRGVAVARNAPRVSHLLFADDTLIFCQASREGLKEVHRLLGLFAKVSGLHMNLQKSAMVFSRNVDTSLMGSLAAVLGVQIVAKHDKYLGLPTSIGKSKREIGESVKERIWGKLNNWTVRKLSQAERAVLIKTVIQAIPVYVMGCFRIPDSLLAEIESMTAKFFWHGELETRTHRVSWRKVCQPTRTGGLGFRRLKEYNMALLAKQAWRIATEPDLLLHKVLHHRYFPGSNFFAAEPGRLPSFTWRSLLSTKELLVTGLRWKIGDGCSARIFDHPWLLRVQTFQVISKPRTLQRDSKVAVLITHSRSWNHDLITEEFLPEDAEAILSIPLTESPSADIVWHFERSGRFSVKSAYASAVQCSEEASPSMAREDWRFLWRSRVLPKVRMFMWRCGHGALPTLRNLKDRGVCPDTQCPRCDNDQEDLFHVLFTCSFARLVWALTGLRNASLPQRSQDDSGWIREAFYAMDAHEFALFLTVCWSLWNQRNIFIFEGINTPAHEVVAMAKGLFPNRALSG